MRGGHAILNMAVFPREGGIWELLGIHIFVESVTGTENSEYKSPKLIKCLRKSRDGSGTEWRRKKMVTKEPMRSQSFRALRAPGRTAACILSETGNYYTQKGVRF